VESLETGLYIKKEANQIIISGFSLILIFISFENFSMFLGDKLFMENLILFSVYSGIFKADKSSSSNISRLG